jgi:hypothetical protein
MEDYNFNFNMIRVIATFENANYFQRAKKITERNKIYPKKLVLGILMNGIHYFKSLTKDDLEYLFTFFNVPKTDVETDKKELVKKIIIFIKDSFIQPTVKKDPNIEKYLKEWNKDNFNSINDMITKGSLYFPGLLSNEDYPWVIKFFYDNALDTGKCINDTDMLSQEEIKDIPKEKIIRIWNRHCFDIDYLVEYLISSNNLNRDPSKQTDELWRDETERLNIINHPGLDKEIKKRYNEMLKKVKKEEEKFIENLTSDEEKINFLNMIALVGTICLNDEAFSFSDNEKGLDFIKAQKAIEKFLSILNERQDKQIWFNLNVNGKSLQEIVKIIKDTCIHGIGRMLIEYYISVYNLITQTYKQKLELSKYIIKISDKKYITHQISTQFPKRKPQSFNNRFKVWLMIFKGSNVSSDRIFSIDINGLPHRIIEDTRQLESYGDKSSLANIWIQFNNNYYESMDYEF